jgi:hypothetical protein
MFFVWALCMLTSMAPAQQKPKIEMAKDGFPTGQSTPEGAACDFARALTNLDKKALRAVVMPPHGTEEKAKQYESVLDNISASLVQQAASGHRLPDGPKVILVCFAARSLTEDGPRSYAYAAYSCGDLKFVDVKVQRADGKPQLCRTLTLRQPDGKWVVDPVPSLDPLLSEGLNDEKPSTKVFRARPVVKQQTEEQK